MTRPSPIAGIIGAVTGPKARFTVRELVERVARTEAQLFAMIEVNRVVANDGHHEHLMLPLSRQLEELSMELNDDLEKLLEAVRGGTE